MAATNNYRVQSPTLNWDAPDAGDTMTVHGFALCAGNDAIIGRLSSFTPPQLERPGTLTRELNRNTYGRAVDLTPGIDGDGSYTLGYTRTEVWRKSVAREFGDNVDFYDFLSGQVAPLRVKEQYSRGNVVYLEWTYLGIWHTQLSPQEFSADGDPRVIYTGQLMFVNRVLTVRG